MMPTLTIFTPTYNRAHTLPRLFDSLKRQTNRDFEWLVINDGSSDITSALFEDWLAQTHDFPIIYKQVSNGGKNRAINTGLKLASGRYFMILDSDDLLTDEAVEFILKSLTQIDDNQSFIGLSGKKGGLDGVPLGLKSINYNDEGYIDCNNLERQKYHLERDMAEVFKTDMLRKYEFKVWPGEKFTPEEVVWNQIALDGYKLRWFNKVIYLCEYQEGGLSDSTWSLLKNNPMGYAMMFDHRMKIHSDLKSRINNAIQYGSCCILAKEYRMISKSQSPLLTILLSPVSYLVSQRRKCQFKANAQ
ncbi:MAG: glycosyltransferase family 2 protein [Muribaculum sp.]|nr:glycosyltransferase family 2 protein [Muribaculum sp.]